MTQQKKLQQAVSALDKQELIGIVLQAAERDEVLAQRLLMQDSKKSRGQKNPKRQSEEYRKLIKAIAKRCGDRHGFITVRDTRQFAEEVAAILDANTEDEDLFLELELAITVLEEAIRSFDYADDSNGDIGYVVDEALSKIGWITKNAELEESDMRERLFERLLELSRSDIFEEWSDWRLVVLRCCEDFAGLKGPRKRLIAEIEKSIARVKQEGRDYSGYEVESLNGMLLKLIEEYGEAEEAQRFLESRLELPSFRQAQIDRKMQEGDAKEALRLAEEGERLDRKLPGLVTQWKKARYAAYKKLNRKADCLQLAEELLLDGEYEYYAELEEWGETDKAELYEHVKSKLKEMDSWRMGDLYERLIEDHRDLPAQLEYVQANPERIEDYIGVLLSAYRDEVHTIFKNHIVQKASEASNRKKYWVVCRMIERYAKTAGRESRDELVGLLTERYASRPAMMDELSRIR
ncbi:hypothetical protein QWJ34_24915 [Saccharibacillus sp. CPCC 101409]|uniref:hypothetical protein n=1 Tax=Saccharibacillus sp. CPCC 101409 TaxID=3058041 RepID=UPI0026737FA3|nr:hypothetical protein [Saccharibacillus sp. CPCC 101409]MDO3413029.1 hypothetical protein [Saccharibacillus sp. CPCC 101409]